MNITFLSQLFELRQTAPDLVNRHGFIIANPGEGTSPVMKKEIVHILTHTKDRVIVIDTSGDSGEFPTSMIKQLGGQLLTISPDSNIRLDILSSRKSEEHKTREEHCSDKASLLFAMHEALDTTFTSEEKSAVYEIIADSKYAEKALTIEELIDRLCNSAEDFSKLIKLLKSSKVFYGPANVDLDNRLTIFNIMPYNNANVLLFPVLDFIRRDVEKNHSRRTWVYFCNADTLFHSKTKDGNYCIANFWRKARMRNVVCTGTILKTADSEQIQKLVAYADCVYILEPQPNDTWCTYFHLEPFSFSDHLAYIVGQYTGFLRSWFIDTEQSGVSVLKMANLARAVE